MRTVKVKICGMTNEKDLKSTVDAGADAVGFVVQVPASPRNLTLEKAGRLINLVPSSMESVVVAVPKNLSSLLEIYEKLKPDAIQIHGNGVPDASPIRRRLHDVFLIRAVDAKSVDAVGPAVEASRHFDAILLDTLTEEKHGGTGKVHDWKVSNLVKQRIHPKRLILAGGLTPKNVKEAIRIVQPYGVDVSTGVESRPGVKDPKKVAEFIKNAKAVKL